MIYLTLYSFVKIKSIPNINGHPITEYKVAKRVGIILRIKSGIYGLKNLNKK